MKKSNKSIHKKSDIESEILGLLKSNYPQQLSKNEILEFLSKKERKYKDGTFYNAVSMLKKRNLVISDRSFGTNYKWNKSKNENNPYGVEPTILNETGFVNSVLELSKANGFENISRVHDIHLVTDFWNAEEFLTRLERSNFVWRHERCYLWKRNIRAKSWILKLLVGHYHRVTFQFYERGRLTCTIKCMKKAIPANLDGLRYLGNVILEACLVVFDERKFWSFPKPDDWIVTLWHYGKDSKCFFGSKFDVTFKTFFGGLARIYVRKTDGRLRIEEIQDPRKSLSVLKEEKRNNKILHN